MERIQSAIAKARAERRAVTGNSATVERERHVGLSPASLADARPEGGKSAVEAKWAALPKFEPDPDRMAPLRVFTRSGGPVAGAFDVLRTRVLQQMQANNWRRLAITSPTASCGKSTVATNLAFSLTRQPERRVILAELDLRRPSLASILGLTQKVSFASTLAGNEDFARHAVTIGGNLAVACNSHAMKNPSELLHSSTVPGVLERIETEYAPDILLFDEPPIMAGDDALGFAKHVDAVLIVAAAEDTTVRQIDACERELAQQTNIMGVVLNKCRYTDNLHDYSYGYSYTA